MSRENQKDWVLLTGASSGIGLELARVFAQHGHSLILVARSRERLHRLANDLSQEHGVDTSVIDCDLTRTDDRHQLEEKLTAHRIGILVNNAGFGAQGLFHRLDRQQQLEMLELNITAVTDLTHRFLQPMVERNQGRILNVASTAAFQPGPKMAVYYATKAYVLSFSEALAEEFRDTGITITALCPGPTKSEFQARAEMEKVRLAQWLMETRPVAEAGYRGLMAGRRLVVPGWFNKVGAAGTRFMPRTLLTQFVKRLNSPA